jgi:hypothetical protein
MVRRTRLKVLLINIIMDQINMQYKIWLFDKWKFIDQGMNTFQRRMVRNLLRAWFWAGSRDHFPTIQAWLKNSESARSSFSRGVRSGLFRELRIPIFLSCGIKISHNPNDIERSPLIKPRRMWWEVKLQTDVRQIICKCVMGSGWNWLGIIPNGRVR